MSIGYKINVIGEEPIHCVGAREFDNKIEKLKSQGYTVKKTSNYQAIAQKK